MVNDDMAHKHLLCRDGALERILRGTTVLTDAVRVTLGSRTKSVLIAKKWGRPLDCNDRVTIAKEIELEDSEEAIFAEGVRNIAAGARCIRKRSKPTPDLKLTADGGSRITIRFQSSSTALCSGWPAAAHSR